MYVRRGGPRKNMYVRGGVLRDISIFKKEAKTVNMYVRKGAPTHIKYVRDATQSPGKSAIFSSLKRAIPPSLPLLSLVSIFPADRCPVMKVMKVFSFNFPKIRVYPPPSPIFSGLKIGDFPGICVASLNPYLTTFTAV